MQHKNFNKFTSYNIQFNIPHKKLQIMPQMTLTSFFIALIFYRASAY